MAKLSIVVPSRDEKFLIPTIDDIFRNARGEIECIAVLDSDKWPENWKEVTDRHPNLHTIHNGEPKGMRYAINAGVASAKSRGAKFIAKFDGHCSFSEGFDEVLKADMDDDWIVVPRRGRLDPENWCETELQKPPIDYHYLSFPDDPNDFGGPGLNGKIWPQRALERANYEVDEEMSSQGSGWAMKINYFDHLELMDAENYGQFWSEFQELGLKCWLSGGRVMVNKKCKYLHLHKGSKYGRGYRLPESWLQQGATFTRNWIWNDAWAKQTKPFKWLIEHFWPVPTWPENWEEVLYAKRKPRMVPVVSTSMLRDGVSDSEHDSNNSVPVAGLKIHAAYYGIGDLSSLENVVDVTNRLQSLVSKNSLDIVVNNSTLTPDHNPFRGKKKRLQVTYSIDGGEPITIEREEKDWLIIGPVVKDTIKEAEQFIDETQTKVAELRHLSSYSGNRIVDAVVQLNSPRTAPALNDYLIRRFQISPQRLRGPMPIELRDFHRNDLAQLFAELGFKRGAEIGVAEGNYCLVPGTKILKTDLTWVNVESLSVGDCLIGFDEFIGIGSVKKHGRRAQMKVSVVQSTGTRVLPSYLIVTDKGEVGASADHLWVTQRNGKHQPTCRFWCKTSDLRIGDALSLYSKPWDVVDSYEAGYLAGFFDGEGSYHNNQGLCFAQNPGHTLERAMTLLANHGFQTGPKSSGGTDTCLKFRLKGRKAAMRFIGMFRPARFFPTSQRLWLNASTDGSSCEPARIVEIKPIGNQQVIGLGTSTKTLIANGFLSHNSEILLKANPDCELLLVDPWHAYSDNPQNKSKEKHEFAYNETLRKVKPYENTANIRVMIGRSMDVVLDVKNDSLDFCYIDGNHLFDYVMQDLIEWSKRVRSGGIVSGDDYYALDQKRWVGGGVVEAVQAYTNAHRIPIWYLFAGHKSVDYFWCKP